MSLIYLFMNIFHFKMSPTDLFSHPVPLWPKTCLNLHPPAGADFMNLWTPILMRPICIQVQSGGTLVWPAFTVLLANVLTPNRATLGSSWRLDMGLVLDWAASTECLFPLVYKGDSERGKTFCAWELNAAYELR